ncbi:hypothetical protein SteCoe_22061 [Stentor coeruleus]|uniref:FYVE-type domain-containing protein n=1 Tax=Stentor coeruleus TaxID=5963 RepID=A0A1R2BN93_9CILI|nr:hypothetical protein SteCoe_22061 [Stentor coeruleus]
MEKTTGKNQCCPVCKTSIGFLSKKVECSNCKLTVCRDHSVMHENSNRFCNICEKNLLKNQFFPDVAFHIKSLKSDLEYLEKEKSKIRNEVLCKNDIVNRLEKQYKSNLAIHEEKLEILNKKILQEQNKIVSEQKLIVHLQQSLAESQKSEEAMVEKLNFLMQENHKAKLDFEEMTENQKFLIGQIDKLNNELRGLAPLSRLTLLSCSSCKKNIKYEFYEVFQTVFILEGRESFGSLISQANKTTSETEIKSYSLCKACNIF